MSSIPIHHPSWCDGRHADTFPVHTAEFGGVHLTGDVDLDVSLYQHGDQPPSVWLTEMTHDHTAVTDLTPGQARELALRLLKAARTADLAGEIKNPGGTTEANSGPGGEPR